MYRLPRDGFIGKLGHMRKFGAGRALADLLGLGAGDLAAGRRGFRRGGGQFRRRARQIAGGATMFFTADTRLAQRVGETLEI